MVGNLIGFTIDQVADKKAFLNFVENDLPFSIITVSEVRRRRAKAIRKVESIVRMCLKLATLRGWKDEVVVLTKMLTTVEDIKADVSDAVNGFGW